MLINKSILIICVNVWKRQLLSSPMNPTRLTINSQLKSSFHDLPRTQQSIFNFRNGAWSDAHLWHRRLWSQRWTHNHHNNNSNNQRVKGAATFQSLERPWLLECLFIVWAINSSTTSTSGCHNQSNCQTNGANTVYLRRIEMQEVIKFIL